LKLVNNILFIESQEFIKPTGLIPKGTYDTLKSRRKIEVIGRGGNGNEALIKYESLPPVYKALVQERFGNPYEYVAKQPIIDLIQPDEKARKFFDNYAQCNLDDIDRRNYVNDAAILNAFHKLLSNKRELKKMLNITIAAFWVKAGEIIKDVEHQYPNTLPTSERRLKPHYNTYVKSGFDYNTLIDGRKFNETNNKKVDAQFEWLIMSLYVTGRPYKNEVYNNYLKFLAGDITLIDKKTGEIFDVEEYKKYGELSDTTIWRILSAPRNMVIIDKLRLNALDYSNKHLPYNERHAPEFSLSKISIDDLEIQFDVEGNDKRVSAYEIIDVASGCIIGKSFGMKKDRNLFMAAIKDMFRFLANNGMGIPAEIEFEHHIANTFLDDLLKDGNVFPFTRLCRAANPREKRAEHTFRSKRYSPAIKNQKGFKGRPFAKSEANRLNERDKVKYYYDDIVAIEMAAIEARNSEMHHKTDKYPGKTRWEVFMENINPNLAHINNKTLARHIGERTSTTIRNNKVMKVQYNNYWLPTPESIELFDSYTVTAYYIREADGTIPEVHLYQNDEYKCTCTQSAPYNESQVEQTADDKHKMHVQFGYRSKFDKMIRDGVESLAKMEIISNESVNKAVVKPARAAKISKATLQNQEEAPKRVKVDYSKMAEDDL